MFRRWGNVATTISNVIFLVLLFTTFVSFRTFSSSQIISPKTFFFLFVYRFWVVSEHTGKVRAGKIDVRFRGSHESRLKIGSVCVCVQLHLLSSIFCELRIRITTFSIELFLCGFHSDAEVLKDRDLSGELKDIWGAVQAKRMREKDAAPSYENYLAQQNQIYIDFGPESSNQPAAIGTDAAGIGTDTTANANELPHNTQSNSQLISVLNVDEMDGPPMNANHIHVETNLTNSETTTTSTVNSTQLPQSSGIEKTNEPNVERQSVTSSIDNTPSTTTTDKANGVSASVAATVNADTQNSNNNQGTGKSIKQNASSTTTATNATSTTTTPKKDKLAGFLPNGCHNIFPFIKTKNSHDKNSNKDKTEHTAHNAHNGTRKSCSSTKDNNKFIQQNNTANLECELAKIDLSKWSSYLTALSSVTIFYFTSFYIHSCSDRPVTHSKQEKQKWKTTTTMMIINNNDDNRTLSMPYAL